MEEAKVVQGMVLIEQPAAEETVLCDLFSAIAEMGEVADGQSAIAQLNQEFTALMNAIAVTRAKGKLTIDVVVAPAQISGTTGEVLSYGLALKIKSTVPRMPPPAAIMYRWPNGRVSQHHPDQGKLFNR